jgi:hypothetical protein
MDIVAPLPSATDRIPKPNVEDAPLLPGVAHRQTYEPVTAIIGTRWYQIDEDGALTGRVDGNGQPLFSSFVRVEMASATDSERLDISVAHRLVKSPRHILAALCKINGELVELGEKPLDAERLMVLISAERHVEAIDLLQSLNASGHISFATAHLAAAALALRDYKPLDRLQRDCAEQITLEHANAALTAVLQPRGQEGDDGWPWYGPRPALGTIRSYRAEHMRCGTFSDDTVEKAARCFPSAQAAHEPKSREAAPERSPNAGAELLSMLRDVSLGVDEFLARMRTTDPRTWEPLTRLHPSDYRQQLPLSEQPTVLPPVGWLDETCPDTPCAKFKRGFYTLFIRPPTAQQALSLPGLGETTAPFVLTHSARNTPESILHATGNWISMIAFIELLPLSGRLFA